MSLACLSGLPFAWSPLYRTSDGPEGWGVRHSGFQTVWSALMISLAINTLMILGESGPFLSLYSYKIIRYYLMTMISGIRDIPCADLLNEAKNMCRMVESRRIFFSVTNQSTVSSQISGHSRGKNKSPLIRKVDVIGRWKEPT